MPNSSQQRFWPCQDSNAKDLISQLKYDKVSSQFLFTVALKAYPSLSYSTVKGRSRLETNIWVAGVLLDLSWLLWTALVQGDSPLIWCHQFFWFCKILLWFSRKSLLLEETKSITFCALRCLVCIVWWTVSQGDSVGRSRRKQLQNFGTEQSR